MQRASCLTCHRRKLKCSREITGCSNCRKGEHKCEYPAAETRTRGKRGPYNKRAIKQEDVQPGSKVAETKNDHFTYRSQGCPPDAIIESPGVSKASHSPSRSIHLTSFSGCSAPLMKLEVQQSQALLNQMWRIFVMKVDPMTKIVHCPSLERQLFNAKGDVELVEDGNLTTLTHSICYAAAISLSSNEAQFIFGADKSVLVGRYQEAVDKSLALSSVSSTPDLAALQALVLYIIILKRQGGGHQLWPLFGLAVRMAQLLQLGTDNISLSLSPLETELRKRIWWTLCWLEKQCAEDLASRPASILVWSQCSLPLNINDYDVNADDSEMPRPRTGITDMTFCLIRFEVLKLFFDITKVKPDKTTSEPLQVQVNLACEKGNLLANGKAKLDSNYLMHCNNTRSFDWLTKTFVEVLLAKAEIMSRKSTMSENEAFYLSLVMLRNTYRIQTDPRVGDWSWFFKDFVQSHALVKVISELCKGPTSDVYSTYLSEAWALVKEMVDRIPLFRRRDPVVSPIITLMGLAQHSRASSASSQSSVDYRQTLPLQTSQMPALGNHYAAKPIQTFADAWVENAIDWGSGFLSAAILTPDSAVGGDVTYASPDRSLYYPGVPAMETSSVNIDWSQWDCSSNIFNTNFGFA